MARDDAPNLVRPLDWRDLPENAAARQPERRLPGWLETFGRLCDEHDPDQVFRALYVALLEDLAERGDVGLEASREAADAALEKLRERAQRALLQAAVEYIAAVRNYERLEQPAVARTLGISTRAAQSDIARVRAVLFDGRVRKAALRPLPPVPDRDGRTRLRMARR